MDSKLLKRLGELEGWDALTHSLELRRVPTPFYMLGVAWDRYSPEGINGMHFYNTREGFIDIDFVSVNPATSSCKVIARHYNLRDKHIMDHINSVLTEKF